MGVKLRKMKPSDINFCHPYQPYDVQLEFMSCLYDSIESGKVVILESPTGTGKSLSLICGTLTWLRDNSRRQIEGQFDQDDQSDTSDWLMAAEKAFRKREYLRELLDVEQKLLNIRERESLRSDARAQAREAKRVRVATKLDGSVQVGDDEYMLDDYESGSEKMNSTESQTYLSSSTLALLDKLKPKSQEEIEPQEHRTKIIFCSRTHSQLTQFINELRRVKPPSGMPYDESIQSLADRELVKHLPLGSRKNLCINEKVLRLGSTFAINERCLELQKPTAAKEHKCKYLPGREDMQKVEIFRGHAIATIRDIEDLGKLGQKMEVCPYYASRSAIPSTEVLTLPYPLLLQKSAREALGVQIKGNVVVIDEAHNLMDAIADTVSMSLSLSQLQLATEQVIAYVQRFRTKLKGANRMYITQLIRLLNSFTECLRQALDPTKRTEFAITAADLLRGKGVDQLKPHKLLQYLVTSKLSYKVEGYIEVQNKDLSNSRSKGILMHLQSFLGVLMNPDSEGRFFVSKEDSDVSVRYTLLDPREHFRDIVDQARSVVLAGGTMSPMSDYENYLFSYLDSSQLSTFSFGHVVPKENILAITVGKSSTGSVFDFTFNKRNSSSLIAELGNLLLRISCIVPDGVVVFFPSYDYLAQVTTLWRRSESGQCIMDSIAAQKQVFEEVRGSSSDDLLQNYAKAVDEGKGAIMLSIVGGKLSEGINFSDKLGRAVIAIGLPFPNMHSAEWKAKIEHVEQTTYMRCREAVHLSEHQSLAQSRAAGKDFYENACMRAVNQSIGRAIRHSNDYAAILLVDHRFATERIQRKLPGWIRSSMMDDTNSSPWASVEHKLRDFFNSRV